MTAIHDDLSILPPMHVAAALLQVVEDLESAYMHDSCIRPSDLVMHDYFEAVFTPGELVVLSGNSEMRNSFFASEMIHQLLMGDYGTCGVFSRDSKAFARTLLAQASGIGENKLLGREWFDDDDWPKLREALEWLNSSRLLVGEIPLNMDLLKSSVKKNIELGRINCGDGVRSQLFVDNLQQLLEQVDRDGESLSTALSTVLTELKKLAVEMQLQVTVVNQASEADLAKEQSVIVHHADAILSLVSRPDQSEFGQEANCTFSMSVNGQVTVEPTSLRIDVPM